MSPLQQAVMLLSEALPSAPRQSLTLGAHQAAHEMSALWAVLLQLPVVALFMEQLTDLAVGQVPSNPLLLLFASMPRVTKEALQVAAAIFKGLLLTGQGVSVEVSRLYAWPSWLLMVASRVEGLKGCKGLGLALALAASEELRSQFRAQMLAMHNPGGLLGGAMFAFPAVLVNLVWVLHMVLQLLLLQQDPAEEPPSVAVQLQHAVQQAVLLQQEEQHQLQQLQEQTNPQQQQ